MQIRLYHIILWSSVFECESCEPVYEEKLFIYNTSMLGINILDLVEKQTWTYVNICFYNYR